MAGVWPQLVHGAAAAAGWLDARDPAAVPPWAWAAAPVLAALAVGRFGGRHLTALLQLLVVAAAVLVAWQMVRPAPVGAAAPQACAGACAAARVVWRP